MVSPSSPELRIRELGQLALDSATSPNSRVLATAFVLFYDWGIRAVGVDLLIREAGVAKASFYRHYPSKEALIVAYLDGRHTAWMSWLQEGVDARAKRPVDQLLAVFDCLAELIVDPEFRGCAMAKALAEAGAQSPALRQRARANKEVLLGYIEQMAVAAGARNPRLLAEEWMVLIDGTMSVGLHEFGATAAATARRLAEAALERHLDDRDSTQRL